jgi:Sec-independent protein translocase protein TatA
VTIACEGNKGVLLGSSMLGPVAVFVVVDMLVRRRRLGDGRRINTGTIPCTRDETKNKEQQRTTRTKRTTNKKKKKKQNTNQEQQQHEQKIKEQHEQRTK